MKQLLLTLSFLILLVINLVAQDFKRDKIPFDSNWKFATGHASDQSKDFSFSTSYFSYLAKAGYGDGPAAQYFDDRPWKTINLPHDWAVELPFSPKGSYSHGFKAIGKNFPENSIGWYRKSFKIPESDYGKKISIEFDGIFRNSIVWLNGFYLGTEPSGYNGFCYDITDYLNYGGDNVITVRADASMEEGWYYEGAGIYRHAWLNKTSRLHIERYGTFITSEITNKKAIVKVRTSIKNEFDKEAEFNLSETIVNQEGKILANNELKSLRLKAGESSQFYTDFVINNPVLWSTDQPYLHRLQSKIRINNQETDQYETTFGIRTVRFDPDSGFFLNGVHLKILGTNNHQDHAGVGYAIPDGLFEFRIKKLKEMGSNAIRTSHEPPSPAFLDACDRLGMLVLDENRLMGINEEHFRLLKDFMMRDRNHPSVILWSLGNEEWAIEGNEKGERIAKTMQDFAQQFDSTRAFTAALSGGWEGGTGKVVQVMGYNYIVQGNIDEHHKKFPWQAGIGTEESNTVGTRGVYETNDSICHLAPVNRMPENVGTESGWQFYASRPFLSGLFFWTGFDYRGEPSPYDWPAIASQFGIIDLCGFPKDIFYYLRSWWGKNPVLHSWPHWNWQGQEGKEKKVTVYSNCEQVELFLNNKKISKKDMPLNGHLEWIVPYKPGVLMAKGYSNGKPVLTSKLETSGEPNALQLTADKSTIEANGTDICVVTVQALDNKNRLVPIADNDILFSLDGPGKIIGVGNGDPSSHEPDKFVDKVIINQIANLKELAVDNTENRTEVISSEAEGNWKPAFKEKKDWKLYTDTLLVVRGIFTIDHLSDDALVTLFAKSIVENQSVYINGKLIAANVRRDSPDQEYKLDKSILKQGANVYAVVGQRFRKKFQWDEPNTDPGVVQIIYPAKQWRRKLFNGYAQLILQSELGKGTIKLKAESMGIKAGELSIDVK